MAFSMIKGDSVKDQIAWIDRYLYHTKNKIQKKITIGIAPVPVSGYCLMPEADGTFFKYMVPVGGCIRRVMLDVVGTLAKGMTATVTLFKVNGLQLRATVVLREKRLMIPLDGWQVEAGDKVKVRFDGWGALIEPDPEGKSKVAISEVWIAFALYPNREENYFTKEDIVDEGLSD